MFEETIQFAMLRGKVIRSIRNGDGPRIDFQLSDGSVYSLQAPHRPGAQPGSYEFLGDIAALVGAPVLAAELSTCDEDSDGSFQPAVSYRLRTANGSGAVRLAGELSGFYSIAVDHLTLQDPHATPPQGSCTNRPAAASAKQAPYERLPHDLSHASEDASRPRPTQWFRVRSAVSSQSILASNDRRHAKQPQDVAPELQECRRR